MDSFSVCNKLVVSLIADDNHTAGYRSNLQFIDLSLLIGATTARISRVVIQYYYCQFSLVSA